jgi:hypothetical protein
LVSERDLLCRYMIKRSSQFGHRRHSSERDCPESWANPHARACARADHSYQPAPAPQSTTTCPSPTMPQSDLPHSQPHSANLALPHIQTCQSHTTPKCNQPEAPLPTTPTSTRSSHRLQPYALCPSRTYTIKTWSPHHTRLPTPAAPPPARLNRNATPPRRPPNACMLHAP